MFAYRYISGAIFTIRGYILKLAAFFKLYIYNIFINSKLFAQILTLTVYTCYLAVMAEINTSM